MSHLIRMRNRLLTWGLLLCLVFLILWLTNNQGYVLIMRARIACNFRLIFCC